MQKPYAWAKKLCWIEGALDHSLRRIIHHQFKTLIFFISSTVIFVRYVTTKDSKRQMQLHPSPNYDY